ncbi:MAG: hypothetical protein IKI11_11445 [Neisseriaceae bacterium]|nr:hypothetical protein [Neisseriaceae bacterium]
MGQYNPPQSRNALIKHLLMQTCRFAGGLKRSSTNEVKLKPTLQQNLAVLYDISGCLKTILHYKINNLRKVGVIAHAFKFKFSGCLKTQFKTLI